MTDAGLPTHRRYSEERRRLPRAEVDAAACLVLDDRVVEGRIDDLTRDGACFTTPEDVELEGHARVLLRAVISTPSGDVRIAQRGAIVRSDDLFDGEHDVLTYGIAFDEPLAPEIFDALA